jgi:hypothetical protein
MQDNNSAESSGALVRCTGTPYDYKPGYWWLSFVDPRKPKGQRFLGVAIVMASSFDEGLGLKD